MLHRDKLSSMKILLNKCLAWSNNEWVNKTSLACHIGNKGVPRKIARSNPSKARADACKILPKVVSPTIKEEELNGAIEGNERKENEILH